MPNEVECTHGMMAFNVDATVSPSADADAGADAGAFESGSTSDGGDGDAGKRSASGQRAGSSDAVAGSSRVNEWARAAAPRRTGLALARADSNGV